MRRADVERQLELWAKAATSVAPEVLSALALVLGWVLLTLAITNVAPPRITWEASAGVFLISCFGWRMLAVLALNGLYALTRDEKKANRA